MFLDLMRDKSRTFPDVLEPATFASVRIWHCGYSTLAPVSRFINCRILRIATFPDSSFDVLAGLSSLEVLEITHMPRVRDISALVALQSLTTLELATIPSWDSSGKVTEVDSLAPLRSLPNLRELRLFGVRPPDRSVNDIIAIPSLRVARISKYPKGEILRLASELAQRS